MIAVSNCSESQEKSKSDSLTLKLCPFCNGHPREYPDGLAWTIKCCATITDVSRERAVERWNLRGGEHDPYHARCPNCGRVGFWTIDQTIPEDGEYDYRTICGYCHGTVGIRILGRMMRHEGAIE